MYYCFGCKAGGTVIQFVMEAEHMDFGEAVRYLADKVHMPLPKQVDAAREAQERSRRETILALNRKAALWFHERLYAPEGARALAYLHGRGLDDAAIRMFGLGAAPAGWDALTRRLTEEGAEPQALVAAGLSVEKGGKRFDMFRDRVIFPIVSAHGAVLGFGGRMMGDGQPKYLNTADTPAFNKRLNVYAANLLRKSRGLRRVLLVEGYMDVVSLTRHGVEGAAATLGTALTPEQARLLKRYAPEVWVAYDGDDAGQNAILKALDVLASLDIPARVLVIPDGMDPDEFIRARGREAFEAIAPLSAPLYRMQRARSGLDLSTEDGRAQYAIACAAILRGVRQPVEVENLLKRLMVETGYSRDVLVRQMGAAAPEKPAYTPPPRREKLPEAQTPLLSDALKAERTLLALLSAGLIGAETVDAASFSPGPSRQIAEALLRGERPAALLERCEDEDMRRTMLAVFSEDTRVREDEALRVAADCLEQMRRGWIEERIRTLTADLSNAQGHDKLMILQEIKALGDEKSRLRTGRKE